MHIRCCRHWAGGLPNIIWLSMKLTILLILLFTFQMRAHTLAQEVNLNVHEAEFRDIMISIQKQTGFSLIAKESLLKKARPVSIRVSSKDVKEVLPLLFRGQ